MKKELIELFRKTRKLTTEWFEADNLDEIRLTYQNGNVVVENFTLGKFFNINELSEIDIEILLDSIDVSYEHDLTDIEVLYYTKRDNKYNIYYIQDNILHKLFECDSDDDLYQSANEFNLCLDDLEFIHI
jgi:hypothetical protein